MAYGDITNSPNTYRSPGKPGVQTVRKAVLLKDGSTIGSAAVNYLNDTKSLEQLTSSSTASTTVLKADLQFFIDRKDEKDTDEFSGKFFVKL